jgi:hypothetical protein
MMQQQQTNLASLFLRSASALAAAACAARCWSSARMRATSAAAAAAATCRCWYASSAALRAASASAALRSCKATTKHLQQQQVNRTAVRDTQ